jgi:hypothetical protein
MAAHDLSPLALAKERLTIPELAERRGWNWTPGKSCRVPWREDRAPSGSVLSGGLLLHDFASGETYDGPALLAKVEGLDMATAARVFIELAGVRGGGGPVAPLPRRMPSPAPEPPPRKPALPRLAPMTPDDLAALAALRGLHPAALAEASRRGLLWRCLWRGSAAWALVDESGWICQARRMDGLPFPRRDEGPGIKAWTLPGSRAGWPLGAAEACRMERVALVEGGPDLLAALHLARAAGALSAVGVCAILGAGCRIVPDALPLFRGKRVRVYPHADAPRADGKAPGMEGAGRWQDALTDAGALVDAFDLSGLTGADGRPLKDLNDVAREWPRLAAHDPELAAMMNF